MKIKKINCKECFAEIPYNQKPLLKGFCCAACMLEYRRKHNKKLTDFI